MAAREMETTRADERRGNDEKFCPHCSQILSKTTFYSHRHQFYKENKWIIGSQEGANQRNEADLAEQSSDDQDVGMPTISNEDDYPEKVDECDELDFEIDTRPEIWTCDEDPEEEFENEDINQEREENQALFTAVTMFFHLLLIWQMCFSISDSCMESLLSIIGYFLTLCQLALGKDLFGTILDEFPSTVYKARRYTGLDKDEFIKFIVCPKCDKLYTYNQSFSMVNGKKASNKCNYVEFPNHPHERFRQQCGTLLMKTIWAADGKKTSLYPFKIYTYQSFRVSLQRLIDREDIRQALQRNIEINNDCLFDAYDGNVWRQFRDKSGDLYFQDKRNLGGLFNIDWFQPFKNSEHSIGALYVVLQNLPREIRFRKENILLVGLIPGPKEPQLNVNTYLKPMVNELLQFWNGIDLKEKNEDVRYRFALVGTSSDLPATRKSCGFLSYNADRGCSKCLKRFPRDSFGAKPDYSGYDMSEWIPRTGDQHKQLAANTMKAQTKTEKATLESSAGARYSEFFRLPYFDPIQFHVVDPMHNLLLGTAKHTFRVWMDHGVIDDEKISEIDRLMEDVSKSKEVGRVTRSMGHYKSLKAEEWKNWVSLFSLYCLKDILPKHLFNTWQIFVRACNLLLQMSISDVEIEDAHRLLQLYCVKFQETFGKESCTPNMHMHLHLKECIFDYGPVYAFWTFSFERYNGKLGSFPTNNRDMTVSMMKKFIDGVKTISSYQKIDISRRPSLEKFNLGCKNEDSGTYGQLLILDQIRRKINLTENDFKQVLHSPISMPKIESFDAADMNELVGLVQIAFPSYEIIHASKFVKSFDRVFVGRKTICSKKYRKGSTKDFYITARYDIHSRDERPGEILGIYSANFQVPYLGNTVTKEIEFLKVSFFEEHPKRYLFGKRSPMTIWSTIPETTKFIPLNSMKEKVSVTKAKVSLEYFAGSGSKRSRVRGNDIVYYVI